MGSLCCVAARPHGSNAASQEWSVGPQEPFWRTNTSFSPPLVRREFRHQSGGLVYGSLDGNQQYGSSTSSGSGGSRSWVRTIHVPYHQYSVSDHAGQYFSSPSDRSTSQQTTPNMQGMNMHEDDVHSRAITSRPFFVIPALEGTSTSVNLESGGSTSSMSDGSEFELAGKSQIHTHHNFSGRLSFMSKPIHPLSFPTKTSTQGSVDPMGYPEFDSDTPNPEAHPHSSGSSSVEFTDLSESLDSEEVPGRLIVHSESLKCTICERFLSKRSPWSSQRIVRNGDMPVASVLSCRHVYHAECLERETVKASKSDPPCPLCAKLNDGSSPWYQITSKVEIKFPRLKSCNEDGPSSRPWDCGYSGDCVDGALQVPPSNTMVVLNTNRMRSLSSKSSHANREFLGKLQKSSISNSLQRFSGWSNEQKSKSVAGPSTQMVTTDQPVM